MSIAESPRAKLADRHIRPRDVARIFDLTTSSTHRLLASGVEAGEVDEARVPRMRPRYRLSQVLAWARSHGMEPLINLDAQE
jgi:hypothetical protein